MLKSILFISNLLMPCRGSGLLALTRKGGKCMTVKSSRGTELEILWEAPSKENKEGMQEPESDELEKLFRGIGDPQNQEKRQQQQKKTNPFEGMLDASKTKRSATQITVESIPSDSEERMKYFKQRWSTTENNEILFRFEAFDVDRQFGSFRYNMKHDDLRLCISTSLASPTKPEFVGIRVKEAVARSPFTIPEEKSAEEKKKSHENMEQGRNHMKLLERELNQFISRADAIEKNIDASNVSHSDFHNQSVRMQKAAIWYPIVHVIVILITAVLNAKSMVKMLRKKGVIYY